MLSHKTISYSEFLEYYTDKEYVIVYDDSDEIILIYREDDCKNYLHLVDYPYYFAIRYEDFVEHQETFRQLKLRKKISKLEKENDEFVKVFVHQCCKYRAYDEKTEVLGTLAALRIKTFEADLTPAQRITIDHKLKVATKYKTLFFDIETDDRGKIDIGKKRIVSIAAVNEAGEEFYWSGKDEVEIVKGFLDKLVHYDLCIGWNSEKFDIPYIKERCKYFSKEMKYFNWRQVVQVDMMQKLMEIHKRNIDLIKEVRSFALNSVAQHFLGEKKVEHSESIWELFTKNPEKLREYNIQDCRLLLRLEQKLKIIGQKIAEHSISGCFLNEFAVSRILDTYILKNAVGSGVRFKSKPPREELNFDTNKKSGYTGGLVLDPVRGLHKHVLHFDFTSLYPSIIQTFNISPETWLREKEPGENDKNFIYTPNKQVFSRELGIIPSVIGGLLKARNDIRYNELKNLKEGTQEYEVAYFKQYAFKTISNSFYGILGADFTRYYRKEIAEAITLSGHFMLNLVKQWCEAKDIQVLYGDTDSVFVKADHDLDENRIHTQINEFLAYYLFKHFGILDSKMDLKVEAVYDSFLLVEKKKYVKNEGGHLKIVGLEARKRDTLQITVQKQTEFLENVMLNNYDLDQTIDWILDLKKYVLSHQMTRDEVMLQIKLSKHVDEYMKKKKNKKTKAVELDENGKEILLPSSLSHIKVANWLKENNIRENGNNTWEKGSYVKFVVVDGSKKLESVSIHNYEDGQYDAAYYWDVKIFAPIQRILNVVFPEHDWTDYYVNKPRAKRARKPKL